MRGERERVQWRRFKLSLVARNRMYWISRIRSRIRRKGLMMDRNEIPMISQGECFVRMAFGRMLHRSQGRLIPVSILRTLKSRVGPLGFKSHLCHFIAV